ncbi:MAG: hypothetical protein KAH38_05225 [Candidatus Hydrogenedentes bacterium]|nr:hypothetical protein [Candidatus Hydrogenedentota bacterium]
MLYILNSKIKQMKRNMVFLLVSMLIPAAVGSEFPKDKMNVCAEVMEQDLLLSPFVEQLREEAISLEHTAVLYAILKNTHEVCIHQQMDAKGNQVYLSPDGHKEAVYDKNGKLVKEGVNQGSYNYFHPTEEPLYHFSFDISPWIMWGQSRTDSTTVRSRIYAYMGDLEGGIRTAIKQKKNPEVHWKSDGQIQAIAVFIRAIKEGKAEGIFSLFEPGASVTDKQLIEVLTKLNRGLEKVYSVPDKDRMNRK